MFSFHPCSLFLLDAIEAFVETLRPHLVAGLFHRLDLVPVVQEEHWERVRILPISRMTETDNRLSSKKGKELISLLKLEQPKRLNRAKK